MTDHRFDEDDVVRRLTSLKQYDRRGNRAPHKPLLLLMAIGELVDTGSSALAFSDVEDRLGRLIKEYVPNSTSVRQTAAYPFRRLQHDQIWVLDREVTSDSPTKLEGTTGRLEPSIEEALLENPNLLKAVVSSTLTQQFSPTLHDDILAAVGLDSLEYPPEDKRTVRAGAKRSAEWRRRILQDWQEACAFCGYDGSLGGAPVGIEAAHIKWVNLEGPNHLDNGLALCSLHHKLFDRGVLGLSADCEVRVSRHFKASSARGQGVYELVGVRLRPRPGTLLPAPRYTEWHGEQVFHGPAIA